MNEVKNKVKEAVLLRSVMVGHKTSREGLSTSRKSQPPISS